MLLCSLTPLLVLSFFIISVFFGEKCVFLIICQSVSQYIRPSLGTLGGLGCICFFFFFVFFVYLIMLDGHKSSAIARRVFCLLFFFFFLFAFFLLSLLTQIHPCAPPTFWGGLSDMFFSGVEQRGCIVYSLTTPSRFGISTLLLVRFIIFFLSIDRST